MQVEDIKPDLMVHAKTVESIANHRGGHEGGHGVHIGTVDHVDGGRYIKLKSDLPDGHDYWIPLDWVEDVDDKAVYLNRTSEEVRRDRFDEDPLYTRKNYRH